MAEEAGDEDAARGAGMEPTSTKAAKRSHPSPARAVISQPQQLPPSRPPRLCAQDTSAQTKRLFLLCAQSKSSRHALPCLKESAFIFEQDALNCKKGASSVIDLRANYLLLALLQVASVLRSLERSKKTCEIADRSINSLLPHLCYLIRLQLSGDDPHHQTQRQRALQLIVTEYDLEPAQGRGLWRVPVMRALMDAGANPNVPVSFSSASTVPRRNISYSGLLVWAASGWDSADGIIALLRAGADPGSQPAAAGGEVNDLLQVLVRHQAVNLLGELTQHAEVPSLLASASFDAALQRADRAIAQAAVGDGVLRAKQVRHELCLLRDACADFLQHAAELLEEPLIPNLANIVAGYLRPNPEAAVANGAEVQMDMDAEEETS